MSELLESLNTPSNEPAKSWASEVAAAAEPAAEAAGPATEEKAAPEPEAVETSPAAPETQETESEEQPRQVPLKALQEERQKRAQYEQMLYQREQEIYQLQQWAAQQQAMQQQAQYPAEQTAEPDPETDPIGALKYAREQQHRLQEALAQQQEQVAQRQYVEQLNTVAYQAATQMQQVVPDYQDAYKYAINSRAQELVALGTHPQAVAAILQQEELRLIDTALQNRKNPAQAIYEFAKARGFQGKTAAAPAPAPVAAPAPTIAPDPVLQETKRAVAASASAGGAPASKGQVTPSDLANLNGAAFDAAWNKMFSGNKSSIFRE